MSWRSYHKQYAKIFGYKLEGTELETVLRLETYYSLHLETTLNQDELKRLKH